MVYTNIYVQSLFNTSQNGKPDWNSTVHCEFVVASGHGLSKSLQTPQAANWRAKHLMIITTLFGYLERQDRLHPHPPNIITSC